MLFRKDYNVNAIDDFEDTDIVKAECLGWED